MNNTVKSKVYREAFKFSGSALLGASVGATTNITFNVEAGKRFVVESLMWRAFAATSGACAAFMLQVSRASKKFFYDWVPCNHFGGAFYYNNSGVWSLINQVAQERPIWWKYPYKVEGGNSLIVDLKNEVALSSTIYITLLGYYEWK
jgi:phage-related tail fiber protein